MHSTIFGQPGFKPDFKTHAFAVGKGRISANGVRSIDVLGLSVRIGQIPNASGIDLVRIWDLEISTADFVTQAYFCDRSRLWVDDELVGRFCGLDFVY